MHSIDRPIGLLKEHSVTAVYNARSSPYSQYNPQLNREPLLYRIKQKRIGVQSADHFVMMKTRVSAAEVCMNESTAISDPVIKAYRKSIDRWLIPGS